MQDSKQLLVCEMADSLKHEPARRGKEVTLLDPADKVLLRNASSLIIQKHWRGYRCRKDYKRKVRRQKKKSYTAFELLQSERSYCQRIKFVIEDVLKPSRTMINDDEMHQFLFNNIEQIYTIHERFLQRLQQEMQNYHNHLTKLSLPLLEELFHREHFKTAYTNYCFNYRRTNQVTKLLINGNRMFAEHLKKLGLFSVSLSLDTYMIKPVQRLCQYKLLMAEYLKAMQPDHIDYSNIQLGISCVQKLVRGTNEQVEEFLLKERYRELRSLYPNVFHKLPTIKRRLFFQSDTVVLVNLSKQQQIVYKLMLLFSDCLLLIRSQEESVAITYIVVRELPNFKYFRNMVQVIDEQKYYVLQLKQEKSKKEFLEVLTNKTDYLSREDYHKFIKVQVLGTETRQSFFSSYTVYIVQVEQNGKVSIFYPRFKNLLKIQDIISKEGAKLNVPRLYKQSPYATLKSRTIEKRKLHIQQFLQRVLNEKIISSIDDIENKLCDNPPQLVQTVNDFAQVLITLPNLQKVRITLQDKQSKIKDLKSLVADNLGLQNSKQFEIFEIRNKNYLHKRLMHDEELAVKILEEQKAMETSINPFRDSFDYMFTRHYYLSNEEENLLYRMDSIRAELELAVIHSELHSYRLEENLMTAFLCLFAMYIRLPITDRDKVSAYLREASKKTCKLSIEQFQYIHGQVAKLVSNQKDQQVTLPLLIIKVIMNNPLYECQQFQIEVHQKCYPQLKKQFQNLEEEAILGLNRQGVYLMQTKDKGIIKSFHYNQLMVVETHPTAIVLEVISMTPNLRFKTLQGFEIVRLFEIYKGLWESAAKV